MKQFVAFLDILGFKDLVMNNDHDKLVQLFNNLFSLGIQIALANGAYKMIENNGVSITTPDLEQLKVHSISISDTVIFWTDNDTMADFINLTGMVRNFLNHSLQIGFPMRGAIVLGEMTYLKNDFISNKQISQQSIIGRSIVDAYIIEGSQEWAGCIVSQVAVNRYLEQYSYFSNRNIKDLANLEYLIENGILARYNVPRKTGIIQEDYVINWPAASRTMFEEAIVRNSFSKHNKNVNDWNVELKIRNTIEFLKAMKIAKNNE